MVTFKIKTPPKTYNGYKLQGTVKKGRALIQRKKLLRERGKKIRTKTFNKDHSSIYVL